MTFERALARQRIFGMESDIDCYRAGLDGQTLELVDVVRKIIAAFHPGLTEEVKWNAASFAFGGEDRITLGLERKGGVRVVLHRGAKPLSLDGFNFVDDTEIARWPAPDRGIFTFRDRQDFELRAAPLPSAPEPPCPMRSPGITLKEFANVRS